LVEADVEIALNFLKDHDIAFLPDATKAMASAQFKQDHGNTWFYAWNTK